MQQTRKVERFHQTQKRWLAKQPPAATLADLQAQLDQLRGIYHHHHLGIGYAHTRKRVLAIAHDTTIAVIELSTGEILSTHDIDPARTSWRNTHKAPGRWPGAQ